MAIVINGSGTVTGLSVGGLPDGTVDSDTLATDSVVTGKIADGTIANADINNSAAIASTKLSGVPSATTYMAATGGTITTVGNYKVHTFTSSGTFTVTTLEQMAQLIIYL